MDDVPTTCTHYLVPGEPHCPEPAVMAYRAGCKHEHVTVNALCAGHLHLAALPWFCGPCEDAGHECKVMLQPVEVLA